MSVRMIRRASSAVLTGGLFLGGIGALAQSTSGTLPDAQIESNVLKVLASAPELSTQDIQSSTIYGTVTLTGTVQTEELRTTAENLVARAQGVQKVVDELTLGNPPAPAGEPANAALPAEGQETQAPPQGYQVQQAPQGYQGQQAPPQGYQVQPAPQGYQGEQGPPQGYQGEQGPPQGYQGQPAPPQGYQGQQAPPQGYQGEQGPPPGYQGEQGPPQGYQGQPAPPQGYQGEQAPPPGYQGEQAPPPEGRQPMEQGNGQPPSEAPIPGGQQAGIAVTIPAGAMLRIRINRGLSSNHVRDGEHFDGTVLTDVVAGDYVAIPRGAYITGVVVGAKKAGLFKGEGALSLQVTDVTLNGQVYPLTTSVWAHTGADKMPGTVSNSVGLGAVGALVGAFAGGGAGAAIGAGVGAGAGLASSAATPRGQLIIPPESVLTFQITAPSTVRTLSEREIELLSDQAGPPRSAGPPSNPYGYYYGPPQ